MIREETINQGDLPMDIITDPALNAAVSTAIIDSYSGIIITLTGAGNSQTLQNPTDTTAGKKRFTVVSDDGNGSNNIQVNGITLSAGEAQKFIWDGSAWIAVTAVDADDIPATPHGDIIATNVQAYLDELEDEKAQLNHALKHTNGDDDIQTATNAQKGLMPSGVKTGYDDAVIKKHTQLCEVADFTKLDTIEESADVTNAVNVASSIHGVTSKAAPVNADEIGLIDSEAANVLKKLTWTNIKATLKTYFDTLYRDVYKTIYIDAAEMIPATTNGALQGTNEYGTNDIDVDYLAFDGGATEERAQFKLKMPENWDRLTIKAKFDWSTASGSTAGDTVEFGIKAGALSDNDAIDAALGTPQVISDTLLADNGADLQTTLKTPAITVGGTPAVNDVLIFEIYRNTDGTDDCAEDAWLFGVTLQIKLSGAVSEWA